MIQLEVEDRKQLITVLKYIPELGTERGRQLMLIQAGLKNVAPHIDISGSAYLAILQIVHCLSNYGYVTENNQALGLFLSTIKEVDGVKPEQREYLEKMLKKYEMITPLAASESMADIN